MPKEVPIGGWKGLLEVMSFEQWRIQRGGAAPPPVGGLKIFFRQYINNITKPTAYDGPCEY